MPTTRAHRCCDTQLTTALALLRIQLIIAPMIPGRASAAFIPNCPSSDAKPLSFDLIHSFKAFSSLERGGLPPTAEPPPANNASTSTPIAILIAVSIEAIVMPCSLNSIRIFSANEVSLSNTLAIVSHHTLQDILGFSRACAFPVLCVLPTEHFSPPKLLENPKYF